jgi:hypothetical protein
VDPQDASWKVVAKYSYDQLMEKLVERNALITRKCKGTQIFSLPLRSAQQPARCCGCGCSSFGGSAEENRNSEVLDFDAEAARLLPSLKGDERRVVKEGIAIQDYFLRTSTQLTYHGIVTLHQGPSLHFLVPIWLDDEFLTLKYRLA